MCRIPILQVLQQRILRESRGDNHGGDELPRARLLVRVRIPPQRDAGHLRDVLRLPPEGDAAAELSPAANIFLFIIVLVIRGWEADEDGSGPIAVHRRGGSCPSQEQAAASGCLIGKSRLFVHLCRQLLFLLGSATEPPRR